MGGRGGGAQRGPSAAEGCVGSARLAASEPGPLARDLARDGEPDRVADRDEGHAGAKAAASGRRSQGLCTGLLGPRRAEHPGGDRRLGVTEVDARPLSLVAFWNAPRALGLEPHAG